MSPLPFLLLMIGIISTMAMPYDQNTTESSISIERCESGRVCMNICYYNGQRINCTERNVLKSVSFNPCFGEILPSIHLKLIQIDTYTEIFNPDIILEKENLTSYGMNIRFSLSIDSTDHFICADWLACSLDIN